MLQEQQKNGEKSKIELLFEKNREFLASLDKYTDKHPEFRIGMRRSAGKTIAASGNDVLLGFYRLYHGSQFNEDKYYLAACLHCLWTTDDHSRAVGLPQAVKMFDKNGQNAFTKRLMRLLEMQWDTGGFFMRKVYNLVRFCKSRHICIDCVVLLTDILCWDWDDGAYVRKKWAREYNMSLNEKGEKNNVS